MQRQRERHLRLGVLRWSQFNTCKVGRWFTPLREPSEHLVVTEVHGMVAAAHGHILATCGQRQTYLASLIQATAPWRHKEASDTARIGSDTNHPISPASRSTAQREPLDPGKFTVGFYAARHARAGPVLLHDHSGHSRLEMGRFACEFNGDANLEPLQVTASVAGVSFGLLLVVNLQATRRAYSVIRCRVEHE